MNLHELDISFGPETLTLTNQRALFWKRKNTLVLSDLHLGKAAHFRRNGIALPRRVSMQDLKFLENLLLYYRPVQVIIVGDLIHAGKNKEVELFRDLTTKFPHCGFVLVKGNHDRLPLKNLQQLGIREVYPTLKLDGLRFSHQLAPDRGTYSITGHRHPGVRIRLPAGQFARFPCFVLSSRELVLPAFSRFTGLDTNCVSEGATCYAFYEDGFFALKCGGR